MKSQTHYIAKAAAVLQMVFALLSIYYAIKSFYAPKGVGEFSLIKNAATDIYAMLAIVLSAVLLICAYYLFKFKVRAYVISILICLLMIPLLAVGYIYGPLITISGGNSLSLTSEILPAIILLLLGLSYKEFKKVK